MSRRLNGRLAPLPVGALAPDFLLPHTAHAHVAESSGSARGARFEVNGLCLDLERRQVTVDGLEVHLTPTEYELLKHLALHMGKVVTHRDLLRAIWGAGP
jgi:DNA-binding response OmpR family regulator